MRCDGGLGKGGRIWSEAASREKKRPGLDSDSGQPRRIGSCLPGLSTYFYCPGQALLPDRCCVWCGADGRACLLLVSARAVGATGGSCCFSNSLGVKTREYRGVPSTESRVAQYYLVTYSTLVLYLADERANEHSAAEGQSVARNAST